MQSKIRYIFILLVLGLCACSKILDKTDLAGIDEATWDNESTATLYLNRLYDLSMPTFPSMASGTTLPTAMHDATDDQNGGNEDILYGKLGVDGVSDFNTSAWSYIRKINILLAEIDKGALDAATRNKIKSQAYFLRGWIYFQLIKLYGGVPYLNHPQDWITENLYVTRNKTSECIDSIARDFDMATACPASWGASDKGRITRGTAMGIKGRMLLYWASPQFNETNNKDRWERAYQANKNAYDTLLIDGFALYPTFANIWTEEGTGNKEVIMIRSFDGATKASLFDDQARPFSESNGGGGGYQPTLDLVKAFPTKDGKDITDPTSGYDALRYWKNRDPRFDATIAYNGCIWPLSNKTGRRQWMYTGITDDKTKPNVTGFYCRKLCNTSTIKENTKLGKMDWVELRLAEVMLNLAECAAATDRPEEAYKMLTAIRKRAGINPGTDNLYGLTPGLTGEALRMVVVKERRIEMAFEGKRYDDLRRNLLFDKLNGTKRSILVIALKSPYKPADLEKADAEGILLRDKIDINSDDYTKYFNVTEGNLDTQQPINFKPEFYFYGIPTTNLLKNPSLEQNKTWGGQFDPHQ